MGLGSDGLVFLIYHLVNGDEVSSVDRGKKKMHSLEVENSVFFRALQKTVAQKGITSCSSEELLQRIKGGTRIYRSFC